MRTFLVFAVVCTILSCTVTPQQATAQSAKNTVYAELFGNGGYGGVSFNYDRLLSRNVALRVGINPFISTIPITASYLVDLGGPNNLEFGGGITIGFGGGFFGTGIAGYRYQENDGGIFFKAALTPYFDASAFALRFGFGVGYTFR